MATNYEESMRRLDKMVESINTAVARGYLHERIAEMRLAAYAVIRADLEDIVRRSSVDPEQCLLSEPFVLDGDRYARDIPLAFTAIPYEQFPTEGAKLD